MSFPRLRESVRQRTIPESWRASYCGGAVWARPCAEPLAQRALADLPDRGAQFLGGELERPRALEAGQVRLAGRGQAIRQCPAEVPWLSGLRPGAPGSTVAATWFERASS